jgi:hypothetical protein
MKIRTSDKFIAWITLLSGLTVSAVAIYYSVAGLVAIFSAAVIPIIVMGVALEVSKLAGTVWLKQNWNRAPYFIRVYLLAAIAILMLITSMGIFGFLSKAHSDQSLVSGDVQSRIAIYDEKIKTAKDNIDANRKALRQMDEAVDQVMGRSSDEKGADKAVQLRRAQQKERVRLQSEIAAEQKIVAAVSEERAPIAAEVRKVEAEVGPIKYIANFIYGDNPDANVLEKAVTWVIIIIVVVFDPLAVILLLASQYSFQWFRKQEDELPEEILENDIKLDDDSPDPWMEDLVVQKEEIKKPFYHKATSLWPFPRVWNTKEENLFDTVRYNDKVQEAPYHPGYEDVTVKDDAGLEEDKKEPSDLEQWNKMIAEAERAVKEEIESDDEEELEKAEDIEKEAMRLWKHDNPESSLKRQRKLFDLGAIEQLPWTTDQYWPKEQPTQTADDIAKTYQIFPDLEAQLQNDRYKPDLTEVVDPTSASSSLKLSDLKKKTVTYIEKVGQNQIKKTFEE